MKQGGVNNGGVYDISCLAELFLMWCILILVLVYLFKVFVMQTEGCGISVRIYSKCGVINYPNSGV